ncbi:hypothetical protein [Aureimonas altamirensis]|uniref:Putative tyrosine-protein phosphatase CapC n=1 Tax=Aureimonas altamirensis TaxID=370622 RepID=A0A0P0YXD5_9HYPH|nr:hypothetical protein [Aureimonas altamirensis]BAT26093.1 putative tyrosine-protein phosphatase CapC [Aureimonas altamirensis]
MTDAQQLDLTELDRSHGYLVVKHGASVNGAYGNDLLRQANEYVERGALTFVGKCRHRDDSSWVSLFQRIDLKPSSRADGLIEPADRRALL